ncbi:MAG: hypothetical protein QOG45_388 [Chloroflexota bacterium]|nr:hypothetical protein [Chloroflexota bacterium]
MQPMLRRLVALLGTAGLVTLVIPQPAGARTDAGFVNGSGTARGTALRLAPHTGGLTYAITTGDSLASYQGTEGRAQAQALDLGVFGLILTTVAACGQQPPLKPEQVPAPVQANSSHGPSSSTHSLAGGEIAAGGTETAAARANGSSADASGVSLDLPGVLGVGAAVSHAETRLVPGLRREAHADASIASVSLAGGAVQLLGLRWDVTQHTGEAPVSSGGFHVDEIRTGGQVLPPGLLDQVPGPAQQVVGSFEQANRALAPFGIHLTPPAVRTLQDGTVDVGPLRISLGGTTQLSQPLGAALAAAQPARDAVVAMLKSDPQNCQDPRSGLGPPVNAGLLAADIAYGGLTGTGGVDVELGGVHASTEGIAYRNPFGDLLPLPPLGGTTATDTTPPDGVTPAAPPAAPAGPAPAGTTVISPATAGRSVTACVTPGSLGRSGCSARDLARAAAAGGLGVALLLFAGDALLLLRRRRAGAGS